MNPTALFIARDKSPDSYPCVGWTNDDRLLVLPSFISWLVAQWLVAQGSNMPELHTQEACWL